MLPKEIRAKIMALYHFARGADDIADDAILAPDNKRKKLMLLDEALATGKTYDAPDWAQEFLSMAKQNPKLVTHSRDLLSAFLQDTEKLSYANWDELMQYCMRSAAPIGRAFLDIAGDTHMDRQAADHLCVALQILNHVQDISKDFLVLRRVYLPQEWLMEAGVAEDDLNKSYTTPALRTVIHRTLHETAVILTKAKPLMRPNPNKRLYREITCILRIAFALHAKLLESDPMRSRITLSTREYLVCILRTLLGKALA